MALGNGQLTGNGVHGVAGEQQQSECPTQPAAAASATAASTPGHPNNTSSGIGTDSLQSRQQALDISTSFLRSARNGDLQVVCDFLDSNETLLNTSNANGLTALHLASKEGHDQLVLELLKRGADINVKTKKNNTSLHIASLSGHESVVRTLLEHGASVNVQSDNGFTALYMAAQENHENCVRILLESGANQSITTQDGFTPLAVAMQQGHERVVSLLLENDSRGKVRLPALHIAAKKDDVKAAHLLLEKENNPDVTSKSGFTPLHIAAHYGNDKIASLLYERGANVNFTAKHNITPLHVACKWGKLNMVSLLISKGADIQSKTRDGLTPLHCAARSGHDQVVDLLLENGAPIQSKTKNGLAPLHMAAQGEHVDAARILLYHGAIVDEVTIDYLTALHVAAHCGHVRVAKLLLDRQADPNSRALNGFTPLHIACKKNRLKMVELLLRHGADIRATTESGLTPLHVASFMGCMNIVLFLLENGADPNSDTIRGETPLHLAARANQTDIVRVLLRSNANVDARAREDQTPLHVASRLGNVDIVMLLLQHGADVQAKTKDLYTPLHIASKEGQEEVAAMLLDHNADALIATRKGFTALHLAAKYGHLNISKLLLQKNMPADIVGKNGVTALHVATHYDQQPIALLLLNNGASPHSVAKNGHTPLHIAARKNQIDIATTLLEYGAKVDTESKAGFIPLHLSAQKGFTDMTSLLIDHKSDVNHVSKNGLTPLHLCAQEDYATIAKHLLNAGADQNMATKTGFTPLHVAAHYGAHNVAKILLEHSADINACTNNGYSALHQAAQQGHILIINLLLKNKADPNLVTSNGQTALKIADKLGYVTIVESLRIVTEQTTTVTTTTTVNFEDRYRVFLPESMQETFLSDSEDEAAAGDDKANDQNQYRYMTSDDMKSFGDDSSRFDVQSDENESRHNHELNESMNYYRTDAARESFHANGDAAAIAASDNVDIQRPPVNSGFLVSFLVDARGGAMRGCRHSGVRIIVPPRCAASPTRITCKYVKASKVMHLPPLMEGEALASRILQLMPANQKFLGPVIIEIPHFASLRETQREIVVLRSEKGDIWQEHTLEANEDAIQQVLNQSFNGDGLTQLEDLHTSRITRILTNDFPYYFALVTRLRQDIHVIGPEGGTIQSGVVARAQAAFPPHSLMKNIRVGLQIHHIEPAVAARLLGNGVAVSPIATIEPRRRKFHKAITITIPAPKAQSESMVNSGHYSNGNSPTLRLLCSITGGQNKAMWEDVTGSTPLNFQNHLVSFTTTVSARFWLIDARNTHDIAKMASLLYNHETAIPYMAKFVVFAKRISMDEARVRVFCMTDDKEDKTLELRENFSEIAKSKDVEVIDGKQVYIEFSSNLIPLLKMDEKPALQFSAFKENRASFTIRLKDPDENIAGRIMFMKEPRPAKGEPRHQPICVLSLELPKQIIPDIARSIPDLLYWDKELSFLKKSDLSFGSNAIHRAELKLDDIANLLGPDWVSLAEALSLSQTDIELIQKEYPNDVNYQALISLKLWIRQQSSFANGNTLRKALQKIDRDDIVTRCVSNAKMVTDEREKAIAETHLDQAGFDALKDELGVSRDQLDQSSNETLDRLDKVEDSSETAVETVAGQVLGASSKEFMRPPDRPPVIDDTPFETNENEDTDLGIHANSKKTSNFLKSQNESLDSDMEDSQNYALHSSDRCLVKSLNSSPDLSLTDNVTESQTQDESTASGTVIVESSYTKEEVIEQVVSPTTAVEERSEKITVTTKKKKKKGSRNSNH